MNLAYAILALAAVSFAISFAVTLAIKRIAPKIGFVDKPGGRKIHANPKPLGGGVAIFLGFAFPVLAGLLIVHFLQAPSVAVSSSPGHVSPIPAYWSGIRDRTPVALEMIAAALLMHVLGLFDDRKALGPYFKLFVQLSIITGLVLLNPEIRALTFLNRPGWYGLPSIIVTVLWIGAITNAFNFLDNMDGLSAGVAAVCTAAFLVAALSIQQWFVAASLALLLGSLLGFLCFNFAPATIFMGDSGSLLIGLLLGSLTVRTTYLQPGEKLGAGWYSIFAPVIVLAVPLYDLVVVSAIRICRGKSPFVGDTNHFSHRLVARGMSRRTAVLCLYLISAATAIAAIILPHAASTFVAVLVFVQTLLILGVVMLLEQHPLPTFTDRKPAPADRADKKGVVELMESPPRA
ncbi:MAG: putative undecaprenyl-phosphate N-acetylglucosaminyl 1-phosphate transferase [Phycisphaerales bacterium]|nr:putative undecaprenyl-phosphate N-acetylglucosaminyl 1-phosphate transferase [Phycisphaerales bacterium]